MLARSAEAGPITLDTFYEFGFGSVGSQATGCDPADPAGPFCTPSGGTPTTFLDAPPWTFNVGAAGGSLTVTDAFNPIDQFQVFDFGASLGLTSAPVPGPSCGDDPVVCLANPNVSHGVFALAPGNHSITIVVTTQRGGGAGYLRAEQTVAQVVPEPATLLLVGSGALAAITRARRRRG